MMFWQFGIYSIQNFKMEITKKENYQRTLNIFVAKKVSVNRFFCRTYFLQEYYMGICPGGNSYNENPPNRILCSIGLNI